MNDMVSKNAVIDVITEFIGLNEGDKSTVDLLLAVGAQILDVDLETMADLTGAHTE